jgi:tripartite-type tricarboxylate transporter receptor subunit TctC
MQPNRFFPRALRLAMAAVPLCLALAAQAQGYPNRVVRLIEPAGPGSAVDNYARQLTPGLSAGLGQQVIIDNRAGANGAIGAREAARAAPDGYTLLHANINNALNDLLAPDPCCTLLERFEPVTRVASTPLVMVVTASVPAKDLREYIALAKAQPETLTYATAGLGSITQLLAEKVKSSAGIKVREVPYKAIGAELPDLLAGHVTTAYLAPVVVSQHIKSGKLRALAISSTQRMPLMADVPTFAEAGYKDIEATGWNGLFVPKGTPPEIIRRLQAETAKALNAPAIKNEAAVQGYDVGGESPEEFAAFVRSEYAKWTKVIKESNLK